MKTIQYNAMHKFVGVLDNPLVCQMNMMSTDKIIKAFIVNANVVSLSTTGHSKK